MALLLCVNVGSALAQPFAYIPDSGGSTVSVIDVATGAAVTTIPVSAFPFAVGITPDGSTVYTGHLVSGDLSVIDTGTNTATVLSGLLGFGSHRFAFLPSGDAFYVTDQSEFDVRVVSTATNSVTATISFSANTEGIAGS